MYDGGFFRSLLRERSCVFWVEWRQIEHPMCIGHKLQTEHHYDLSASSLTHLNDNCGQQLLQIDRLQSTQVWDHSLNNNVSKRADVEQQRK